MKQIGVRELRQNASRYLREVERGETFEITVHGRPVATLAPKRPMTRIEQLIADGVIEEQEGDLMDFLRENPPLPPKPGVPLPSQVLEMLRADER